MNLFKKFSFFLLPTIIQTCISLFILPFTTYILNPDDYGVFALLTSLVNFGTVISTMGFGYLIAAHYQLIDTMEKQRLLSTMTTVSIATATVFCVFFLNLWGCICSFVHQLTSIPFAAIILSLLTLILGIGWNIAVEIITIEGKAHLYSQAIILQSCVGMFTVLVSLYVFKLGMLSLFVSGFASAFVLCIYSIIVLSAYIRPPFYSKYWMKEIYRFGGVTVIGNIFENMQTVVERYLLSFYSGLSSLGIYVHSQQYKNFAVSVVKANARAVWPVTLVGARETKKEFIRTKKNWDVIYLGLTIGGIFFVFFGKMIVGVLTHQKFVAAYPFVIVWIIFIFFQNLGKPQTGIMFAYNRGILYSKFIIFSIVGSIICMFIFVPLWGAYGVMFALIVQQVILRGLIQIFAGRIYETIFFDRWAIVGVVVMVIMAVFVHTFNTTFFLNIVSFIFFSGIVLIFEKNIVSDVINGFRHRLKTD